MTAVVSAMINARDPACVATACTTTAGSPAFRVLTTQGLLRRIGAFRWDIHAYLAAMDATGQRGPYQSYCTVITRRRHMIALEELFRLVLDHRDDYAGRSGFSLEWAPDLEATAAQLRALRWLYTRGHRSFSAQALSTAVIRGRVEMVSWLVQHAEWDDQDGSFAVIEAAGRGYLPMLQDCHRFGRDEWFSTYNAMDRAAGAGRLDIVRWLHENRREGCTTAAMDQAALWGHLAIMKWLHEHRQEGCTIAALEEAARQGHLEVVQWLHTTYPSLRSPSVMGRAILGGRVQVVKWLSEHGMDEVTEEDIASAVSIDSSRIQEGLKYIFDHKSLDEAFCAGLRRGFEQVCRDYHFGSYDLVRRLVETYGSTRLDLSAGLHAATEALGIHDDPTPDALIDAAIDHNYPVLAYLVVHNGLLGNEDLTAALHRAVDQGHLRVVEVFVGAGIDRGNIAILEEAVRQFPRSEVYKVFPRRIHEAKAVAKRITDTAIREAFHDQLTSMAPSECTVSFLLENVPACLATSLLRQLIDRYKRSQTSESLRDVASMLTIAETSTMLNVTDWSDIVAMDDRDIEAFVETHRKTIAHKSIMRSAARRGCLGVVQYLHARGVAIPTKAVDSACHRGHPELVRWFESEGRMMPSANARRLAIDRGHTMVLQVLTEVSDRR